MREKMRHIENCRQTFIGTFERFGEKTGYKGYPLKTVLLVAVQDTQGKEVTDHLWFNFTKGFEGIELKKGDQVMFDARVKKYWKGYKGYRDDADLPPIEKDYKLSYPNKIRKVCNPLKEVMGKWPGEENIEQILFILAGNNE